MQLMAIVMMTIVLGLGCATASCGSCAGTPKCPKGAVLIPAGTFMMGDDDYDGYRAGKPAHQVTLTKPYCMDRTEVTQKDYYACLSTSKCTPIKDELMAIRGRFAKKIPDEPADNVNWSEALGYCKAQGGRLPTEAEWEFAARGTDGRIYPWGNEAPTPEHWQAWTKNGIQAAVDVATHPKGRSFFGLEDMAGNLWEWTADYAGPVIPKPTVDPQGPDSSPNEDEEERIVKGTAWFGRPSQARASLRGIIPAHWSNDQTGMRCAYDTD